MSSTSQSNCTARNIVAFFSAIEETEEFLGVDVITSGNVTIS